MSTVAPKINTYLDFQGMGELRGQAQRDQDGALREVAQQFESMFVQMMMKSMREAGFGEGMLESREAETFQSMHDKEIAQQMSRRGGLGIADMLVDQMSRNKQQIPTAADALSAHQADMMPFDKPRKALDLNPSLPVFSVKRPNASGMSLKPEMSLPGAGRRANARGGNAE
jgi:Rod binding domain-containing protein